MSKYQTYYEEDEEPCDGKIKFYKDLCYGTVEECPECGHMNMTWHTNKLCDDLDIDYPENWTGYCLCCGHIEEGCN